MGDNPPAAVGMADVVILGTAGQTLVIAAAIAIKAATIAFDGFVSRLPAGHIGQVLQVILQGAHLLALLLLGEAVLLALVLH